MKRPSPANTTPDFPPPQPLNHKSRKTRDLPNLSDCQCCNRRINCTNPKNRLVFLTSEWRIVLLCRSCHSLVESAQFCSYCLTRVSSGFYDCKKCRRRIHKDCVSRFSFGYAGNYFDDFSICFDCWIPNLLQNEYNRRRAVRVGTSKKHVGKNGVESASLGSSGLCDFQNKGKALVDVVKDANVDAEGKIFTATEAKDKVFNKVLDAKKAVEFASDTLDIVSIDWGGDQGGCVVDEDAQLAIRLHREMNSSPRILRHLCSVNTHSVDVPKVNGLEVRGANETSCSDRVTTVESSDNGLASGLGQGRIGLGDAKESGNKFGRVPYGKWNGVTKNCVKTYIRKGKASTVVESIKKHNSPLKVYSRKPSEGVKLECWQCPSQDVKLDASQRPFQIVKLEGGQYPSEDVKMDACGRSLLVMKPEAGQCSKTYSRRRSHCKSRLLNNSLDLQNGNISPDMSLNCPEEPKTLANAS